MSKKNIKEIESAMYLLAASVFVIGLALGYAYRMSQVKNTEKAIMEALNGCNQLITDELVISPTVDCERQKTAILGLRSGTFNYSGKR